MLSIQHVYLCDCVPFDVGVHVIMSLAGKRAISTSYALGLIYDHSPLAFTLWRFAGCLGRFDCLSASSNRDANGSQFQKIAAVDILIIHSFPLRILHVSQRGGKSARATE